MAVGVSVSTQERANRGKGGCCSAYYDTIVEMRLRQGQWRCGVCVGVGESVTINRCRRSVGPQAEDATLLLSTGGGIRVRCGRSLDGGRRYRKGGCDRQREEENLFLCE